MEAKQKHLSYIREKGPFILRCKTIIFNNEEIELLKTYGHWFQALTDGEIEPISDMQIEFVKAARKEKDPISPFECAWLKYLNRLAWEADNKHIMIADYQLEEDSFYNRDMAKQQRGMMFGVMRDNHKK